MLSGKNKKRHKSLFTVRKKKENEESEDDDLEASTKKKGFKRMQTTRGPAKNRNVKNVVKSMTVKEKAEHFGLGGMKINQKNKNQKVFDKAENIIEKNGKTIKQTELKTMERKSVIASNKLPLIFKKGKKKKKIKKKKTLKGNSKNNSNALVIPEIPEEHVIENKNGDDEGAVAVKRGSYLMKRNVSNEPFKNIIKKINLGENEPNYNQQVFNPELEEYESYNINNENISSMENQVVFKSNQDEIFRTMESKNYEKKITEDDEKEESGKDPLLYPQTIMNAIGVTKRHPKNRKKSVSFDMVRTGTFKEEFKNKKPNKKLKTLKSSLKNSKYNSRRNSMERKYIRDQNYSIEEKKDEEGEVKKIKKLNFHVEEVEPVHLKEETLVVAEVEPEEVQVKQLQEVNLELDVQEETPIIQTNYIPLMSFDIEEVKRKQASIQPSDNENNQTNKTEFLTILKNPKIKSISFENNEDPKSVESKAVVQEIKLDGAIQSFGNNIVESSKKNIPKKQSFKIDDNTLQSYFKKPNNEIKNKNIKDLPENINLKNQNQQKQNFNNLNKTKNPKKNGIVLQNEVVLLSPNRNNFFVTESFEEAKLPKTKFKISSPHDQENNSSIQNMKDEDVLKNANYEEQKKERSGSVISKGMSRSFNETMNNIYDDVDKTLDFIELQGNLGESTDQEKKEEARMAQKDYSENILGDLNSNKNTENLKNRILSSDLLIPKKKELGVKENTNIIFQNENLGFTFKGNSKNPNNINQLLSNIQQNQNQHNGIIYNNNKNMHTSNSINQVQSINYSQQKHSHSSQQNSPFNRSLGKNILNKHMRVSPARNKTGNVWVRKAKPTFQQPHRTKPKSQTYNTLPITDRPSKKSFKINNNDNFSKYRTERSIETQNYSTSGTKRFAWWRKNNGGSQNQMARQRNILESFQEKLSRSVPRNTGGRQIGSLNKMIYVRNPKESTSLISNFDPVVVKDNMTVRSYKSSRSSKYQSRSLDPHLGFAHRQQTPQMASLERNIDPNMHMSWMKKSRLNPGWKWGTKLYQSKKKNGLKSSMIVFSENNVFCQEDMENRLVQLFMKMLVYSSKIESLKDKLFRGNPSFSSRPLFKEFTNNRSRVLNKQNFSNLLHSFGFNMSSEICNKLMIYLSKYRYTHEHHKLRSQTSIPNSTGNLNQLLSPNDQFPSETPNFKMTTSNFKSKTPTGLNSISKQTQNNSSEIDKSLQYHLNFEDFREFIEKLNAPMPPRMSQNSQKGVGIRGMDYHLIRQIVILLLRKLEDIGGIILSLQKYGSLPIFVYLLKFNPSYFQSVYGNSRLTSLVTSPKASLPNSQIKELTNQFEPLNMKSEKNSLAKQKSKPNSITSFMRRRISKKSKKNVLGKSNDSEELEEDFILGNDQVTDRFTNVLPSIKSGKNRIRNFSGEEVVHLSEEQMRDRARELIQNKRVLDEDTIQHFLEFHQIQFMPRDLTFIMSDLGTRSMELGLEMFDRFLFSRIWDL